MSNIRFLLLSFAAVLVTSGVVLAAGPNSHEVEITIRNMSARHQVDIRACYAEPDITHALGKLVRIDNCINDNKTTDVKFKKGKLTAMLNIHYEALPVLICGIFSEKDEDGKTEFPHFECKPFAKKGKSVTELELDAVEQSFEVDY